jgi:hypothetical protein
MKTAKVPLTLVLSPRERGNKSLSPLGEESWSEGENEEFVAAKT